MADAYEQLEESWAEIADISHGLSILSWDQEVMMPPGGAELRAHTLAALTGVVHGKTTSTRLARLVDGLHRGRARLTPRRRRAVELVRRDVDRARKIPARLAKEVALTESRGLEAWRAARAASDFARFAPVLARMVELKREVAARVAGRGVPPYDALLTRTSRARRRRASTRCSRRCATSPCRSCGASSRAACAST